MLSMEDPLDVGVGGATSGASLASCVCIRIARTEEQMSLMMQRFTAYVIEVSDFGQTSEVSHRYGDFETLYKALLAESPGLSLPPLPPKGVDGTDAAVVATRKVELEKLLKAMLGNVEVLMEKQLSLWKFLNLPNPAVIAGRFVAVPRCRMNTLKTLAKLNDPKYKDDVYRLAHPPMAEVLMDGLRELRKGNTESGHWCWQPNGRANICQLIAGALGCSEAARARFLELDVLALLLGLVEREESGLDDARTALNVIVAHEAERFPTLLGSFLARGGLSQLAILVQRPKCQEFVAKLLWLAWDAPARSSFAQPGGQGLRVLQALLRSSLASCSLLGAVLLSGLIASGDFNAEPAHRAEALRMVRSVLERPEAASDPQFTKTLCGATSAIVRLAGLLDDADLAPLILNLLCTAKPPAAKLARITGNLANLVSDRGGNAGRHNEETRARAAELLLHIQGSGVAASSTTTGGGQATSMAAPDLERCEGIAAHEESLESALRAQLEEGVVKSRQTLEVRAQGVREVITVSRHRLQVLPRLDFNPFDKCFASFKTAREDLEKIVGDSEGLHRNMERQLLELRNARPSSVDPHTYKERLAAAERLYNEVKSQREALAVAEADAKEKQAKAEASSSQLRRAADEAKKLEDEIGGLRLQRSEKETQATTLRHKANTPSLDQMKEQAKAGIERNLSQARELQMIGQRVQQGDPDYLKAGETRESKMAELAAKLAQLKKQQQQLLQQQKDLDFDPAQLLEQAGRLEAEAREVASRIDALEVRRLDFERDRASHAGRCSHDSEDARAAQDRRSSLAARVSAIEQEARSQMSTLQPMIQEHHTGWQRLLAQQKKLDSDQHTLSRKLDQAGQAVEMEALTRRELAVSIQELMGTLQGMRSFLEQVGAEPPPLDVIADPQGALQAGAAPNAESAGLFAGEKEEAPPQLVDAPPLLAAPAPPATAATEDDFDAFLREDPAASTFSGGGNAATASTSDQFVDEL
mmetsp:Transcript_139939/g.390114  ORF Transcript_139939/g.390114 Transcript_139939/m.390114 type:complete len:987 (+) Transcript_139939:130-3090(+)